MVEVVKERVPAYDIFRIDLNNDGFGITLTVEEANDLYEQLTILLGKPIIKITDCGDRYSHRGHPINNATWCSGRSQDQT